MRCACGCMCLREYVCVFRCVRVCVCMCESETLPQWQGWGKVGLLAVLVPQPKDHGCAFVVPAAMLRSRGARRTRGALFAPGACRVIQQPSLHTPLPSIHSTLRAAPPRALQVMMGGAELRSPKVMAAAARQLPRPSLAPRRTEVGKQQVRCGLLIGQRGQARKLGRSSAWGSCVPGEHC